MLGLRQRLSNMESRRYELTHSKSFKEFMAKGMVETKKKFYHRTFLCCLSRHAPVVDIFTNNSKDDEPGELYVHFADIRVTTITTLKVPPIM